MAYHRLLLLLLLKKKTRETILKKLEGVMDDLGLFGQNEELGVLLAWWPLNEDYFTRHHFDCGGLLN